MTFVNQMQDKLLSALHSIVDVWELEWVQILGGPFEGTVRLMQVGGFRTLLKIEYEFQTGHYRLLVYREGKHVLGRCNMDYDDGLLIEETLAKFRCLLRQTDLDAADTGVPAAPLSGQTAHDNFRRAFCRSLGPHA
jgi:hypothetical protein